MVKNPPANAGDAENAGSILGSGRSPWRRKRLPTPVLWPGELHGLYSSWSCKELNTTEQLSLLRGRKAMTVLDSILKSRDITLPTKVRIVKSVVFPVVMSTKELMLSNCGPGEDS